MTGGRLVAAVAVVVAVLMSSSAVAGPAAMSVSVAPSPVARGAPVTVSGRTTPGARVEVYLGALVAATTATAGGTFRTTFRATGSGVVKIVARGRGSVTRTRALSVFVLDTSPVSTVYVHEGQVASPCMSGRGVVPGHAEDCRFASPVVEIPAGATLHFAWTVTDRKSATAGVVVGYGEDRAEREIPADAVRWWQSPEFADPDLTAGPEFPDFDLRPGISTGRFLFEAGQYLTWSVTITETHPIRRFV